MDRELDAYMAALPADEAKPGDGMRYLLEHAPFLVEVPQRINFKMAVRRLLREGRVGEAILAALAYDARTVEMRAEEEAQDRGVVEGSGAVAPEPSDPAAARWR